MQTRCVLLLLWWLFLSLDDLIALTSTSLPSGFLTGTRQGGTGLLKRMMFGCSVSLSSSMCPLIQGTRDLVYIVLNQRQHALYLMIDMKLLTNLV